MHCHTSPLARPSSAENSHRSGTGPASPGAPGKAVPRSAGSAAARSRAGLASTAALELQPGRALHRLRRAQRPAPYGPGKPAFVVGLQPQAALVKPERQAHVPVPSGREGPAGRPRRDLRKTGIDPERRGQPWPLPAGPQAGPGVLRGASGSRPDPEERPPATPAPRLAGGGPSVLRVARGHGQVHPASRRPYPGGRKAQRNRIAPLALRPDHPRRLRPVEAVLSPAVCRRRLKAVGHHHGAGSRGFAPFGQAASVQVHKHPARDRRRRDEEGILLYLQRHARRMHQLPAGPRPLCGGHPQVEVAVLPAGRRDKEAGGLPGPPPAVPKDEKHLKLTPALPREGAERQRPAPAVPAGLLFPRRHAGFVNAPFRRDTGLKPHLVQRERPWIDRARRSTGRVHRAAWARP